MVSPQFSSAVPQKSHLSSAWHRFPWPPEEMKDLVVYSKVANISSSRAAFRDISFTLKLKQVSLSHLLLALESNGEERLVRLKAFNIALFSR